MTEIFNINIAVRPGDAMSVILLKGVLDYIMKKLVIWGNISTKMVEINAYAEVVVIISGNLKPLEKHHGN